MLTPQFLLPIHRELVVDLFAGGGGASTGIEQAIGRPVDVAVNHDPEAVSLHQANHPQTRHFVSDVFEVDPLAVTDGQPVGLLWASPDCKHFSKAKGGKPVSNKIRSLAWIVIKWIRALQPTNTHPRVIHLENVEEFRTWGPLGPDQRPCPQRKGRTFNRWVAQLRNLGYAVEWRELRACDYGAPTIRKRLFLVARRDGQPIVWPEPTHAAPDSLPVRQKKLQPWRTAAECIDWHIPAPSIFERQRPLAEATCRRIAKGIMRYVVDAAEPFIVRIGQQGGNGAYSNKVTQPLTTITTKNEHCLAVPHVMTMRNAGKPHSAADEPTHTITAGGAHQMLVAAFMAKHYGGEPQAGKTHTSVERPAPTVLAQGGRQAIVTSHLAKLRGDNVGSAATDPVHTISAQGQHHAEVRAFLVKYYGTDQDPRLEEPMHTVPTKDRFGLVMVHGEPYAIVDIGMRMLTPRELYRAQGFPESYQIERGADGRELTKTAQVRMCGNSVCPPLARALVAANYTEQQQHRIAA